MIFAYFTLLFLWVSRDSVSSLNVNKPTFLTVALGDSVQLNCTYNCSTGFVRGLWRKASDTSCCSRSFRGDYCTVSLLLNNVSNEDLQRNYTCYTENTEDLQPLQKVELIVLLQLQAETSSPNQTATSAPKTTNALVTAESQDSSEGEFTGIKVLATVTVAVALVLAALAAFLCLTRNRLSCSCKGIPRGPASSRSSSPQPLHPALSPVKGERVTLRIPTPDSESDTEVPYADIMITVRGVSTPELTQVGYLAPGDQNERWRDEPRSQLQSSRSADRLHIPLPREISRKMSTNSEYAVITYA